MLYYSPLGWLCLIGTVWLVVRARNSRRAQAIGIGVVAIYLWSLASMAVTLIGTTGLSFRLQPMLVALLVAAGVFGFLEGAHAIYLALRQPSGLRPAVLVVGLIGAIYFSQNIPHVLDPQINTAYSDTDGFGHRGDQRYPSAVAYYAQIDRVIGKQRKLPQRDTVVLTGDYSFLSYYPYYGFQAHTSNYGNPMADFDDRVRHHRALGDVADLRPVAGGSTQVPVARAGRVRAARVRATTTSWSWTSRCIPTTRTSKKYSVLFPTKLFAGKAFTTTLVGPFAVITRNA